jgi:hypothetical protein
VPSPIPFSVKAKVLDKMSVFQESGLQITLPVGEGLRFQDSPSYHTLKGKNLSEIDFC